MSADETLRSVLAVHAGLVAKVLEDKTLIDNAAAAAEALIECLQSGGKIMICGDGGSAADSQHFSAELVGRFIAERKGLPCLALTTDTSILTAWANDYDFDSVFARQVQALGKSGDVLVGLSTSGNSRNVVEAVKTASGIGIRTIGLLGRDGGKLAGLVDIAVVVPHEETARVQEIHQLLYHSWCAEIDDVLTS